MTLWRRSIALLVFFSLALYSVEGLIADVHDGDAPASVIENTIHQHEAELFAAQHDSVHGHQSSSTDSDPAHSQHACHCLHSHGAADVELIASNDDASGTDLVPIVRVSKVPPGTSLEPKFRPPIVG